MDESNNFLGFVSKIGSLINSSKTKEKDNKKNKEKKYNIKISTDDELNLDNVDNQEDEEEEEEEEDEKIEEKNENKTENLKENILKDDSEIEKEKEKIKNLVEEIMNNNDKENNEEEGKDNEDGENNIINDNNNSNNYYIKDICPSILNNSFPVVDNDNQIGSNLSTFAYNESTSCHIMLKKGNDINITDYIIIPILFLEKQKNLFYKMGMVNYLHYEPKKYLFFFDEHYLYFAKDEILFKEMDEETRRITKIISIFDIKDFSTDNDNEKFLIKLLVKKEENKEKEVSFYVEQNYFSGFIKNFNLKLSIYGVDFFSNKS